MSAVRPAAVCCPGTGCCRLPLRDERTSKGDCQVLEVIAAHANHSGACWPGVEKIADVTGIHRTTVMRSTMKLAEWGYILIERCEGRSNYYQLQPVASTLRVTSRTDATGSKPLPVASTLPHPSHPRTETSRTDATLTQLLNSANRTQGGDSPQGATLSPEERQQRKLCSVETMAARDTIRRQYRKAVQDGDLTAMQNIEKMHWPIVLDLAPEGRLPPLVA